MNRRGCALHAKVMERPRPAITAIDRLELEEKLRDRGLDRLDPAAPISYQQGDQLRARLKAKSEARKRKV